MGNQIWENRKGKFYETGLTDFYGIFAGIFFTTQFLLFLHQHFCFFYTKVWTLENVLFLKKNSVKTRNWLKNFCVKNGQKFKNKSQLKKLKVKILILSFLFFTFISCFSFLFVFLKFFFFFSFKISFKSLFYWLIVLKKKLRFLARKINKNDKIRDSSIFFSCKK